MPNGRGSHPGLVLQTLLDRYASQQLRPRGRGRPPGASPSSLLPPFLPSALLPNMTLNAMDEKKETGTTPPSHLEHVVSNDSSQLETGKAVRPPRFGGIDAELAMVLERVRPRTLPIILAASARAEYRGRFLVCRRRSRSSSRKKSRRCCADSSTGASWPSVSCPSCGFSRRSSLVAHHQSFSLPVVVTYFLQALDKGTMSVSRQSRRFLASAETDTAAGLPCRSSVRQHHGHH